MTSPSLKKHPITVPSILRSTRISVYLTVFAALVFAPGCGITPEAAVSLGGESQFSRKTLAPKRHESSRYPWHRPKRKSRQTSRFADIERATFFEGPAAETRQTAAPAPASTKMRASAGKRSVASESVPEAEEPVPAVSIPETNGIAELRSCRPVPSAIRQVQNQEGDDDDAYIARDPVDDPRKLKKITEIQPYYSYEPNPQVRAEDPCKNLCPRPDGTPCKDLGEDAPLCPEEVVLSNEQYIPRSFAGSVFAWEASNLHYNPLYFEDVALERYGHTYPCWVQPFASVGKFGVQLVGLPYQMGIDPVCKEIYPLGYYRPGEWAPKLHYQIPWNTKAALTQAGVTTGMFFLIP